MPPTTEDKETDFFYQNESDPRRYDGEGNVQGVYLDRLMREQAEVQRAKVEGREPNFDELPAIVGTPLLTEGQLNPDGRALDVQKPGSTLTHPVTTFEEPNPFPTQPEEDPNAYPSYADVTLRQYQEAQSPEVGSDSGPESPTRSDTSDSRNNDTGDDGSDDFDALTGTPNNDSNTNE